MITPCLEGKSHYFIHPDHNYSMFAEVVRRKINQTDQNYSMLTPPLLKFYSLDHDSYMYSVSIGGCELDADHYYYMFDDFNE